MQLLYNWQLLDYPIPQQQRLSKYITPPKPSLLQPPGSKSQLLNTTIHPMILRSPIFSVVFCYIIQEVKSSTPQIHLFPQLTLFQNRLEISLLQQRRQQNCIYQLIKIQNCQCYQTMITFSAKVKFIQGHTSSKVTSIDKLINLVGSRKLNSHSFQTHSTIKKQLTLEQPVVVEMRYSPKGYMLVKLTRGEEFLAPVWVENVQVLNWLCEQESVKSFQVKNVGSKGKVVKLSPKQTYSVMLMLPENIRGSIEVPISIVFSFDLLKQQKFKIIKYLKIE